jgi:hypothetical protein
MYRHFFMSAAALTLMTGAVFAQDSYSTKDHDHRNPERRCA